MTTQEIVLGLIAALQRLPQASRFTRTQVETWASTLIERTAADPHASGLTLEQQVRRLGGFGASEIGVLVGEQRGDYSPFETARELVARKLLLETPQPANDHLRRGLVMEPLVRAEFLRRSGAIRRTDLTQQVAAHTHARWPWMQATPDDLLDVNGVLGIVDYKVPAEPLTDLSLAQQCQLHQIRLLAEDLGLPVHWQAIVAWNHPRGGPDVLICEHDPALTEALINAGEYYWQRHVLTGELSPWPSRAPLALNLADLSLEAKAEIEHLAGRYLRFDLLAKEAKNLTDAAREQLLNRCRIHGLTDTVTSGAIQIKSRATWSREAIEARLSPAERAPFLRPKWDVKALVDLVRTLGGSPDAACADGEPTLDLDAAAHWLMEARGLPESALRTMDYQSSLSRRKADQALVEPVRDAARTTTYQFGSNAPGL